MKQLAILLFLLYCTCCMGQTPTIDSLKAKAEYAKTSRQKLGSMLALCEQHESIHKDSLWKYVLATRQLARDEKDKQAMALANTAMIDALLRWDNPDSAYKLIEEELQHNIPDDKNTRSIYFRLAAQQAAYYGARSDYESAIGVLLRIITQAEKFNDSLTLARNMNSMGVITYNRNDLPASFNWKFKGLGYCNNDPKYDAVKASLYINLASGYAWVEKPDSAEYYLAKAIPLCRKTDNLFYLANAYIIQANNYKWTNRMAAAEEAMLKAIALRAQTEGDISFSNEQLALANLYVTEKAYDKAITVYMRGINYIKELEQDSVQAKKINYDILINYYRGLAMAYKGAGNSSLYEQTLEDLVRAKDVFYETNSARAIAQLQTQYEVQKKENTIMQQKLDLSRKNYLMYGSIGLLIFAVIVAALLFYNYKKREKLKLQLLLQKEKDSAVLAVAKAEEKERKRIAADLHDNLGTYAASVVSNLEFIKPDEKDNSSSVAMQELRHNSLSIVSQLSDTIWVLNKDALSITNISDRLKVFVRRVQPSFPAVQLHVGEDISNDILLPPSHAYHLFQIVQEAVNNALRHSGGRHVDIMVQSHAQWKVTVSDDGKGLPLQSVPAQEKEGGNGLANMQARAAETGWKVEWTPGADKGTVVTIQPDV